MSTEIKNRPVLSDHIVCLPIDSNIDDNEFIQKTRQDLSKYAFGKAEVIALCDKMKEKGLKVGSTIVYRKSGAQLLRHEGVDYIVINLESAILEV